MDSVGLNPDAPAEGDPLGSRAGARGSVTDGAKTDGSSNGIQNGSHRTQTPAVISNPNGAAVIVTPRPGSQGEIPSAYDRHHALAARAVKRAFDIVGALLLLITLAPVWLLISMLIKADSPGPILFRQRRIGRDGEPFAMVKFRTMINGAEGQKPALLHLNDAGAGLFKIRTDPRVTRFGRWLRGTCLDELPQLVHVITGRMSLVGPRPLVPEEDVQITGTARRRLSMRPGMTGVWQVSGASAIPLDEMVQLDAAYVERWSPWVDVKLLGETAVVVILRKGR